MRLNFAKKLNKYTQVIEITERKVDQMEKKGLDRSRIAISKNLFYIFRISAILTNGSVPDVQTTEEEKPLAGNFSEKNVPSKACNLI